MILTAPVTTYSPPLLRWTLLCSAAEAVGIASAAGAARAASALTDGTSDGRLTGLAIIVAGGLVEGTALGVLQSSALRHWLPGFRRGRYVVLTVLVAGLGWAAGSAPATLSADSAESGPGPALPLVLLGALGLGAVMGAVLGGVQALALRGSVMHPWRWVTANVVGWPVPMAVIFLGASSPGADWPVAAVVGTGLVSGAAAGALLGLVTGVLLPRLGGVRESVVPAAG